MSIEESFRDKTFVVTDSQARIRNDDLITFAPGATAGSFKLIAADTTVKVAEVKVLPTGSQSILVFARVTSADGATVLGWTATANLKDHFVNETIGLLKIPPNASQTGPNALWQNGTFLGQADLVQIVDTNRQIKRLTATTALRYLAMVDGAATAGVPLSLTSGFRSFPEQKILKDGFDQHLPGFNLAAAPGFSNHQNGIAVDIAEAAAGPGHPTYDWMAKNATSFGFLRTVNGEAWHWEFDTAKANTAKANGTFKAPNVTTP